MYLCNCEISIEKENVNIDHNHITGKIRGLLCKQCNIGLGMFKDSTESLENAIEYLNKNKIY